jgi:hypothetical protein
MDLIVQGSLIKAAGVYGQQDHLCAGGTASDGCILNYPGNGQYLHN